MQPPTIDAFGDNDANGLGPHCHGFKLSAGGTWRLEANLVSISGVSATSARRNASTLENVPRHSFIYLIYCSL